VLEVRLAEFIPTKEGLAVRSYQHPEPISRAVGE
jgi:hypothetical protein